MVEPAPGPETPAARPRGPGCLVVGAAFAVTLIIGWLLAITAYGLVVEQWEWIRVRREFSYDWAFLYAPLFAIGCGMAVAFWASRRASAARLTLLIVVAGVIALVGGVALLGLGGLI
ncbi:hypothetical protein [Sphingopyxis sp.]|jgi:hypothetical protein|uniref:hypothetical protein n=1 Tax=Sphingopyxis sp. TaxID=1908224 RepID=UPI002FCB0D51